MDLQVLREQYEEAKDALYRAEGALMRGILAAHPEWEQRVDGVSYESYVWDNVRCARLFAHDDPAQAVIMSWYLYDK